MVSAVGGQPLPTARFVASPEACTTRQPRSRRTAFSSSGSPRGQSRRSTFAHFLVEEQLASETTRQQFEIADRRFGDGGRHEPRT